MTEEVVDLRGEVIGEEVGEVAVRVTESMVPLHAAAVLSACIDGFEDRASHAFTVSSHRCSHPLLVAMAVN